MRVSHTTTLVIFFAAVSAWGGATPPGWGVAPTPAQQADSLRAAIADLVADFGSRYPDGGTYLKELDALKPVLSDSDSKRREAATNALDVLRRKALTASPLVSGAPILFVVRHQYAPDHHNTGTDFQPGPHIYLIGRHRSGAALKAIDFARGEIRTLVETQEGCIRDPDVSFDGGRILFAMRQNADEAFQIYEIHADGKGLKRLTHGTPDTDVDPAYLPDGRIVFTSTRDQKFCGCNRHVQGNLFTMRSDGSEVLQISRNNLYDSRPSVLSDGRIVYDRWEYVDSMFGPQFGLWTVNPDGTQHALYCGNNDWAPGAIFDARALPKSDGGFYAERVVCIFGSCHDRPWGAVAILDRRRGLDGTSALLCTWPKDLAPYLTYTPDYREGRDLRNPMAGRIDTFGNSWNPSAGVPLKYEDPYPLDETHLLCARMVETGKERTGIFLLDAGDGSERLLHTDGPGCFDPQPLMPRARPPVIPEQIDLAAKTGTFYVTDIYRGTGMENVPRGTIKTLRVVEAPAKRYWTGPLWEADTLQRPAMNFNCTNNKRILGDAPVEADGSVYCEAPADRFVFFQLLDGEKMMVQSMRSGTSLQPGEHAGCTGCHENRYDSQPPQTGVPPLAMRRPPSRLKPWYGPERDFNYLAEVQPVFDAHCVKCHDYGKEGEKALNLCGDLGLAFNVSFLEIRKRSALRWYPDKPGQKKELVKPVDDGPPEVLPPYAWGACRSRLADVVRNGHHGVELPQEALDRIVTWIDLNTSYYGTYACNFPNNPLTGCAWSAKLAVTRCA